MAKKEETVKKNIASNLMVKWPKKIFLFGLIFLLVLGLVYFSVKFLLVASVNGQLVSRLTIIKELEKQGGKKTLDTVILKTLINQEAKKRKITISQKDIDAEIQKIETNITAQGLTLDQLLQQQGMKKSDLTEEVKIQLLVSKMVGENINVTDKEIDDFINSQKKQLSQNPDQEFPREQVKQQIKQQKLQQKIQTFVAGLKDKAKINYFIKY
ncbi:MAG: Foldase protein PrsA [Candidatus Roizmanbacteria bacterium GW2011_GWA2_34_18]|uniref:peptidylprolyl isomerase n=1 Tax=Candidatus Roizmanbacteria bacterium GW2011_GWA2_34_18 TaxID=1618477 RepID=A0A0G0BAE0_9BACT|nr:MAG: Foldase protein PrsA [Candidatus Roizmanbacteria bacterium GW2011_GWA2_34_18]